MRRSAALLRALLAALIGFALIVYLISAVSAKAVDQRRMTEKFIAYADTSASGVPDSDYPALAGAITGYLDGKLPSAQITVTRDHGEGDAFSADELQHLSDIQHLIMIAKTLRYITLALIAAGLVIFFVLRKAKPELLGLVKPERSLRWAGLMLFVLLGAVIIWALVDFDSAFVMVHRLLFRNELWLLDPQRDLLMQLMPQPFFVSYGLDLLKENAFVLLLLPLAAFGLRQADKKGKQ